MDAAGRRTAPNLTFKITRGAPPHGEVYGEYTGKYRQTPQGQTPLEPTKQADADAEGVRSLQFSGRTGVPQPRRQRS